MKLIYAAALAFSVITGGCTSGGCGGSRPDHHAQGGPSGHDHRMYGGATPESAERDMSHSASVKSGDCQGCSDHAVDHEEAGGHDHKAEESSTGHDQRLVGPEESPAMEIVNATCPVMGGVVDPAITVAHDGRLVAFCCQDCVQEWATLSAEERAAKLDQ